MTRIQFLNIWILYEEAILYTSVYLFDSAQKKKIYIYIYLCIFHLWVWGECDWVWVWRECKYLLVWSECEYLFSLLSITPATLSVLHCNIFYQYNCSVQYCTTLHGIKLMHCTALAGCLNVQFLAQTGFKFDQLSKK